MLSLVPRDDLQSHELVVVSNRPLIVSAFAQSAENHGFTAAVLDFADPVTSVVEHTPAPSCVLVDVSGDPDAAVRTCAFLHRHRTAPVVLLITCDKSVSPRHLAAMMRCRPAGVLSAAMTPDEMMYALRLVLRGQVVFQLDRSADAGALLERSLWQAGDPSPELTEEEHGLLQMIAAGQSDEEIAAELYLSEATIRRRVSALRRKTATGKRVELAAWGGAHGFYRPERPRASADGPDDSRPPTRRDARG